MPDAIHGAVDIGGKIRDAVVVAVMGGPPESTAAQPGGTKGGEQEGERAAGLEGMVTEVAVEPGREPEHADHVQRDADHQRLGRHARPDRREAGEVDEEERDRGGVDDVVVELFGLGCG